MNIVIHVGAHKTATTFIQNTARNNRKRIEAEGVYFVDKKDDDASQALKKYADEIAKGEKCRVEVLTKQLGKVIAPAFADSKYHTVFLSEENLLGSMLSQRDAFYPHVRHGVAAIDKLRERGDVSILLTLRRQDTYIESCYMFRKIREHREATHSIYDFISRIKLDSLSWAAVAQPWVETFGQDHCQILPYELIKQDAPAFVAAIFKNVIKGEPLQIKAGRSNPGLSRKALRLLNLIDQSAIELTPRERFDLGQAIHGLFRGGEYKPATLMHDYMREEIVRRYEADNEALFRQFMPDFEPTMYSVNALRLELAQEKAKARAEKPKTVELKLSTAATQKAESEQ